jgi:peptidoglycan/LPS O-acetylase OafA/YrhL
MQSAERLPALDGLRAVSILLVVAAHWLEPAGVRWIPGGLGVTIFFFISGFIITRLLLAEDTRHGLAPFYVRRVFRLAPALVGFVVASWLGLAAFGMHTPPADIAATLLYYANYWNVYGIFEAHGPHTIIPPLAVTWSLAVEEHFYMLFPLLVVAYRSRPHRLLAVLVAVLLGSFAWRLALVLGVGLHALPNNRIFMGTDTRLDSIAYGCTVSVMAACAQRPDGRSSRAWLHALAHPLAVTAGSLLMLASLVVRSPEFRETLRYSLQGLALMPLFALLFWRRAPATALRGLLEWPPMVYIGLLSYSLYLYHFLGLALGVMAGADQPAGVQVALAVCFGVAGTLASYYLLETPLRRRGAAWAERIAATRRSASGGIAPSRS